MGSRGRARGWTLRRAHDIEVQICRCRTGTDLAQLRAALQEVIALGAQAVALRLGWRRCSRSGACPGLPALRGLVWRAAPGGFQPRLPDCGGQGCPACHETGLPPQAAATRWAGLALHGVFAALR